MNALAARRRHPAAIAILIMIGLFLTGAVYAAVAPKDADATTRALPAQSVEEGRQLFLANCAPCHNSAAIGGALSRGRNGPSLQQVEAQQVGEAMRTGPGDMPQFGPDVFTDEQVNSIVAYVEYLHNPESPGGASLGYTGPVAEGFVALLIGLGAMVLAIRWITREPEHADG